MNVLAVGGIQYGTAESELKYTRDQDLSPSGSTYQYPTISESWDLRV
eukprot:CAMPEP_0183346266 /NCGR_PEP_ID=MMETSP0164_2-20130417/11440_1 /TAXON_ID=221442 /ORGANISM="Coccolithus pelagicus ssp braarudi, Strain PLY182g" /LENGTH=46 /DNA_ID= /DNA_START= /DNA_END= /DNA_ORIENTATION=